MSAAVEHLFARLTEHGVRARLHGDRVRLEADHEPPPELVEAAREAKDSLLAHLRASVSKCGRRADDPVPLLLECPGCGVRVWRPADSELCLRCEDAARANR